ncbi:MAG: glycosyltransferase family 2 protein [Clostridia bacterium]|nr:glycosyltransferase family 2 protein [Clostridia bacterium]
MKLSLKTLLYALETHAPTLTQKLVRFRARFVFLDRWQSARHARRWIKRCREQRRQLIPDLSLWEKAFLDYLKVAPRNLDIFESFMTSELETVTIHPELAGSVVTALCVVRNDLKRMQMVIEHHRKLGIRHFVVIDNHSDDGTREWLVAQPDIDVYLARQPFRSLRKYGWINQILARYGLDRWYLYLDSDELLVYPGCETKPLEQLVQQLETSGRDRLAAVMLDMYNDAGIYSATDADAPIQSNYRYFDSDSYQVSAGPRGLVIKGGPRKRLFSEKSEDSPLLIKYPLFKSQRGLIFESAHYLFPYQTKDQSVQAALLHYKFLPTDLARHETIAKQGNFQGGSREYKRYLHTYRGNSQLTFMYPGSVAYEDSQSLQKIPFIQPVQQDIREEDQS